jgi:hypothetical protein
VENLKTLISSNLMLESLSNLPVLSALSELICAHAHLASNISSSVAQLVTHTYISLSIFRVL